MKRVVAHEEVDEEMSSALGLMVRKALSGGVRHIGEKMTLIMDGVEIGPNEALTENTCWQFTAERIA